MALITAAVAVVWYGGVVWKASQLADRSSLLVAFLFALPLSHLTLYAVRC